MGTEDDRPCKHKFKPVIGASEVRAEYVLPWKKTGIGATAKRQVMPVTSARLDQKRQPYRSSSMPSSTHRRKTNPKADDNFSEMSKATVVTKQQPAHTSPQLQKAELSSSYQQHVGETQDWSSDLPLPLQRTTEEGYSKGVTTPTCSPATKAGTIETRNG